MEKVYCWKFDRTRDLERIIFEENGKPETLNQSSFLIPAGAYTTFRTYRKKFVFHMKDHLQRLEDTARFTNHKIRILHDDVHIALRRILSEIEWEECRIRITVDMQSEDGIFFICVEELAIPTASEYLNGVSVITINDKRDNPKAKLSEFIPVADYYKKMMNKSDHESLMVAEDSAILEGISSNFFAVKDGIIRTAGSGILEGITRSFVLEIAAQLGIPVVLQAVFTSELPDLQETFITSSSRGILPVNRINGVPIGNGQPGQITRKLSLKFNEQLEENLELI